MEFTEILMSIDFVIFLVVGALCGWLATKIVKGSLVGNLVIGVVGAVIAGFAFDFLNFMDVGDIADPVIAATVGAVNLLAIAAASRR